MNKNLKVSAVFVVMGISVLLSGCAAIAFVPGTVHPHYIRKHGIAKLPGASKVVVDVIVKNEKDIITR
jgi:hypothetical protein